LPPPQQEIDVAKVFAFTLAEVLITLGIIGVVAAITLPTLISNHRKKVLETQFKKGYSTIQNAYLTYSGINNNDINNFISENEWYKKKENIAPFLDSFQYGVICYGNLTPVKGKCNYDASYEYWFSMLRYDGSPIHAQGLMGGAIKLNDGSTITIYNNGAVRNSFIIILDINGPENKPNRIGYDIFLFTIANNRIIPIAPIGTEIYSKTIVLDPQGAGNTYYAVQNVCPTDQNKTYWECLRI